MITLKTPSRIDPLETNPKPNSDLVKFFKDLNYGYSWDYDNELEWHEFTDPKTNKLTIQIEFGISKDQFLKEWFSDNDTPTFHVGGRYNTKEWKNLIKNLDEFKNNY